MWQSTRGAISPSRLTSAGWSRVGPCPPAASPSPSTTRSPPTPCRQGPSSTRRTPPSEQHLAPLPALPSGLPVRGRVALTEVRPWLREARETCELRSKDPGQGHCPPILGTPRVTLSRTQTLTSSITRDCIGLCSSTPRLPPTSMTSPSPPTWTKTLVRLLAGSASARPPAALFPVWKDPLGERLSHPPQQLESSPSELAGAAEITHLL